MYVTNLISYFILLIFPTIRQMIGVGQMISSQSRPYDRSFAEPSEFLMLDLSSTIFA